LTDVFNPGGRFGPFPEGSRGKSGMEKKARDKGDGEGDFLGGTRSPRPDAEAAIKPRHNMIIGAKRAPGGREGTCPGQAQAIPAGVRSPPLRGEGEPKTHGLAGKGPGMTRRAIFSEGRALRVRVVRLDASRRTS